MEIPKFVGTAMPIVSFGENIVSWKSKKQSVAARSSAQEEYRATALVTFELAWIKQLFQELKLWCSPYEVVLW